MITKIKIVGERCSGTNYLSTLVQTNFKNIDFAPTLISSPTGRVGSHKHFITNFDYDEMDTLVICIVRNPYDWMRSLHRQPHHLLQLSGLPFEIFVKRVARSYHNFNLTEEIKLMKPSIQKKMFLADPNNIIESHPNILSMRSYKMQKYFSSSFKNVEIISYDNLVNNLDLLSDIAKKYGIEMNHPTIQNITKYKGFEHEKDYVPIAYPKINTNILNYINGELNWELENKLGFTKIEKI